LIILKTKQIMKKIVVSTLASVAFAVGAFAQGSITPNNNNSAGYVDINGNNGAGTAYSGTGSLQVWYLNGSTVPTLSGNNVTAYNSLAGDGFTLAQTYQNVTFASGGFGEPELDIAGITPAGNNTTFAIVAWNNATSAFGSAANGGVIDFVNPTANYTAKPTPAAPVLSGFTGNLDMATIAPEPTTIAFAAMGLGSFLVARRRK
jgi:hypothetical protein